MRALLRDNDRITPFELAVLMVIVTLEMGVTTFPRTMTEKVGTESWLIPLPGFLFSLLAVYFLVRLSKLFPGKTFVEYSQEILGSIIGKLFVIIVIAFWVSTSARILRQFADVMKVNLLFRTPIEVIIFSMLLFAAYPARYGIEPMARLAIIVAFVTIPVGLFLFAFVIPQAKFDNLLPVFAQGPLLLLKAGFLSVGSLEGIELLLVLLPFITQPRKSLKASTWALAVLWSIIFIVNGVVLAVFGEKEVMYLLRPGLTIIQTIELPTLFVERLSSVYVATWVALIFPSISMFLFLASTSLAKLFGLKEQKILIYPLTPVIFALAILPSNVLEVENIANFLEQIGVFIIGIMPLFLFLIAKIRKKGGSY